MVSLEWVRGVALELPEATERAAYGIPCFRVRDKIFAAYRQEWHGLACLVSPEDKLALPQEDPETFSVPEHYRNSSMVVVDLARIDPDHLTEVLTEAWRLRAPKRLRERFDAG